MTRRPRLPTSRRGRLVVALVATVGLVAVAAFVVGMAGRGPVDTAMQAPSPSPSPSPTHPEPSVVERRHVPDGSSWVAEDVDDAVVAAVEGMVARAPVVVVAAADALEAADVVAAQLHAPLVPADAPGVDALLDQLGTSTVVEVVRVTEAAATTSPEPSPQQTTPRRVVVSVAADDEVDPAALDEVPATARTRGSGRALVMVRPDDPALPLLEALARAAGVTLVPLEGELARDPGAVSRVREQADASWAMAGTAAAWQGVDTEVLAWDVAVARRGVELPGGGLRLFPGRRLVALYGSPGAASLGVLGEQPVEAAVTRAHEVAEPYAELVDEPVIPTFEIIVTVASGEAGPDGDYSNRVPLDQVEPWIDAAEEAGMYVVLDLQPGRTDFLTQAKDIEHLLLRPHVGLALDPEWRLAPDEVHLRQVGSVAAEEVQAVADWLAELTRREALPHKLLLLHQFQLRMIRDREQLRPPPELAVVIQMDGQGSQGGKDGTWERVTTDPPPDVWFGWKNFYDEDTVLRSPADTLAVEPSPVLVSYQ